MYLLSENPRTFFCFFLFLPVAPEEILYRLSIFDRAEEDETRACKQAEISKKRLTAARKQIEQGKESTVSRNYYSLLIFFI